jgi:hypothetical protein
MIHKTPDFNFAEQNSAARGGHSNLKPSKTGTIGIPNPKTKFYKPGPTNQQNREGFDIY